MKRWGVKQTKRSIFGFDGAPSSIEITTAKRVSRKPVGLDVHHRVVHPKDRTFYGVVPVTTPTRTLLDCSAVVREEVLEAWLDQALRTGRTSIRRINSSLERAGGQHGLGPIRRLLRFRDPEAAPNESRLETLLLRILRRAGLLDGVVPQKVIYDSGGFVGRIDFVYPARRLVVEAHSYKFHSSNQAWQADVARWNRLRRQGWRVVLVTWQQVLTEPDKVQADIRAELARETLFP